MNNMYIYGLVIALALYWFITASKRREKYLEKYVFPKELERALSKEFKSEQHEEILEALREYFIILNRANNAKFFVPSKAILTAWRAFILLDVYEKFSDKAFGEYIVPPSSNKKISKWTLRNAFRTVYALASTREGIDRKKQKRLPSIFKLDKLLNIKNGMNFQFKKAKAKKSKRAKSRAQRKRENEYNNEEKGAIFSISYSSSDEYWECSIETDFTKFSISNESSMSEYNDNTSNASSDSNSASSSDSNSSSSSWSSGDSSSDSSSSSSDSGSSSD